MRQVTGSCGPGCLALSGLFEGGRMLTQGDALGFVVSPLWGWVGLSRDLRATKTENAAIKNVDDQISKRLHSHFAS